MSIENPFEDTNSSATEKENRSIEAVSGDEYLKKNLENPVKVFSIGELVEQNHKDDQKIKSKLRNSLTSRWLKESSGSGLIEELGYFSLKRGDDGMIDNTEFDKVYFSKDNEAYFVRTVPIWGEDGEVEGHVCFREKKEQPEEKKELKNEIEIKYEKENDNEWLLTEQERDRILQGKVKSGEMVYLGELTDDEYMSLRKKGVPMGNFEKVVLFDENQDYIRDKHKVYAHILKQNESL